MMKYHWICLLFLFVIGCKSLENSTEKSTLQLAFLDEYIIPQGLDIDGTIVGGLSGIDFDGNANYYLICDDPREPRFYTAKIDLTNDKINEVQFTSVVRIKDTSNYLDLEALRFDAKRKKLIISSEGSINRKKDPLLFSVDSIGERSLFSLPNQFKISSNSMRNNGVLEGLTLSIDGQGYWVGMELPLTTDGPEPGLRRTISPVRVSFYNADKQKFTQQFSYLLEPIAKAPKGDFMVNGLSELLAYDENRFLIIERSFSSGLGQLGNTIRIYLADASKATNTLGMSRLENASYIPATKQLILDFESLRDQLTEGTIDNIEGITFGPTLSNGNRSLLLIADDNFNSMGKQFNQVILLEIVE